MFSCLKPAPLLTLLSATLMMVNCSTAASAEDMMSPSRFTTAVRYTMPEESHPHTATWLQWPHEHQYGVTYRNRLEPVWVAMTKALVGSEAVNIVVYDEAAQTRATKQLTAAGVDLSDVHFFAGPRMTCGCATTARFMSLTATVS